VESGNGDRHVPVPPPPAVAVAHATVTADIGTVEQLVNVVEAVRTVRFQVLLWLFDRQVTVAMELPGSEGESGSVA
jgi:hypothetical protein